MRLRTIAIFGLVAQVLGTSCGEGSSPVGVAGMSVAVTPHAASVIPGGMVAFTATVTGTTSAQSTAVTWSVQEAGGGTVDASGHYTAPGAAGTYHVTAT